MSVPAESFRDGTSSRRAFRRYPLTLTVTVGLTEPEPGVRREGCANLATPRPAYLEDLSVSGLFFVSSAAFPLGAPVTLHLRLGTVCAVVEGIVRRRAVVQVAGKRCLGCGVQFMRSDQTPQALTAIILFLKKQNRVSVSDDAGGAGSA